MFAIRVRPRSESRRLRTWATLPAIALHAAVLWIATYCPSVGSLQLTRSNETFARPRPANERLVYVKPMPKPASANTRNSGATVKTQRATAPATVATDYEIGDAFNMAIDDVLDSAATASDTQNSGANIRRDTTDTAVVGVYMRPIHSALRGLVPSFGDGRLWGPVGAGVTGAAALRPKPPECVQGPGYFGCVTAQRLWRDDSIYHVVFRCRQTSQKISASRPADCARFVADTLKR